MDLVNTAEIIQHPVNDKKGFSIAEAFSYDVKLLIIFMIEAAEN
jgi:hypothetical protein